MFSFLFLISICLGAKVYLCTNTKLSTPTLDGCANFFEIDDSLLTDKTSTSKCLSTKSNSKKFTKVNKGTSDVPEYRYYINNYKTNNCGSIPGQVVISIEIAYSNAVDITTLSVVGTITYPIPEAESAKEYYIGGCYSRNNGQEIVYYNYIASQFGISYHSFSEENCTGSDSVTEIITTFDFNENQAKINTTDVGNNVFSLESVENNIRVGVVLTTADDVATDPQTIYEMLTPTEGRVLALNSESGYYEVTQEKLNLIDQVSVVATGSTQVINKLKSGNERTYFTNKCYNQKSFTVIGNVFAEVSYSEEECSEIESILASDQNKEITIGLIEYIVDFTAIQSAGLRYFKKSELVYFKYSLGKCLKTGETTSEQYLVDLNNDMYCVTYSTAECSTIKNIYLLKTIDANPFEGNTTVTVIDSYGCSITEVTNAVKSEIFKVNECSETTKFVIETNTFIQYTYNTSQECVSSVKGAIEKEYDCKSCLYDKQYLICPSDSVVEESSSSKKPNNEDESSSSISFMIAGIAIITFFIF